MYKQAILRNPKCANTYTNLGSLYKDLGKLDQALACTLKSIQLKPDNPTSHTIHQNLGAIYTKLEQLDQALECTLKSLELKPDNLEALSNLSNLIKKR